MISPKCNNPVCGYGAEYILWVRCDNPECRRSHFPTLCERDTQFIRESYPSRTNQYRHKDCEHFGTTQLVLVKKLEFKV